MGPRQAVGPHAPRAIRGGRRPGARARPAGRRSTRASTPPPPSRAQGGHVDEIVTRPARRASGWPGRSRVVGDARMSCFVALGDSFSSGTEPGVASFTDRVAARLAPAGATPTSREEGARSARRGRAPARPRARGAARARLAGVRRQRRRAHHAAADRRLRRNFEHVLRGARAGAPRGDRHLPRGRRAAAAASTHARAHGRRPGGRQLRGPLPVAGATARSASSWPATPARATPRTSPRTLSTRRTPDTGERRGRWPRPLQ